MNAESYRRITRPASEPLRELAGLARGMFDEELDKMLKIGKLPVLLRPYLGLCPCSFVTHATLRLKSETSP